MPATLRLVTAYVAPPTQEDYRGEFTVAQAAPLLEAVFRQRFGDEDDERLYRVLDLTASEWTIEQEQQLSNPLHVLRTTSDQNLLSLYHLAGEKSGQRSTDTGIAGDHTAKNRSAIA